MNLTHISVPTKSLDSVNNTQSLIYLFIYRYIYLGICTSGLTIFSYHSLGLTVSWPYVIFIFLGTSLLYNYHSLLSLSFKGFIMHLIKNPWTLLHVVSTVFFFFISIAFQHIWIILLAIVIVLGYYSVSIFKSYTFRKNWIKPLSIGLVYALITITFPAMSNDIPFKLMSILTLERVIFIAALALIFDVGDIEIDKDTNHPTVPTRFGINISILIAIVSIVLASAVDIYAFNAHWVTKTNFYALLITYFVTTLLFVGASPRNKRLFYLFYVDGMIGLPFFILLLSEL